MHLDCNSKKIVKCDLEFNSKNPKAYYRMALAYKAENDYDRAQENFKNAIKLAPNDQELRVEYQNLIEIKTTSIGII